MEQASGIEPPTWDLQMRDSHPARAYPNSFQLTPVKGLPPSEVWLQ